MADTAARPMITLKVIKQNTIGKNWQTFYTTDDKNRDAYIQVHNSRIMSGDIKYDDKAKTLSIPAEDMREFRDFGETFVMGLQLASFYAPKS